jgi:hypothetical protein
LFDDTLAKTSTFASRVIGLDPTTIKKDDKDAYEVHFENLREGLRLFMSNFIIQFFHYGYNIKSETMNGEAIMEIKSISKDPGTKVPKQMIRSAIDYYYNIKNELDIYGGDNRFVGDTIYCSSLFVLLRAFIEEGASVIQNYEEIGGLAKASISKITSICQKKSEQ